MIQRILDHIAISEDLQSLLAILKLLIIWTSAKNQALYKLQITDSSNNAD